MWNSIAALAVRFIFTSNLNSPINFFYYYQFLNFYIHHIKCVVCYENTNSEFKFKFNRQPYRRLLLFRPSTPYRPRRTVPSSSRCLSTSSQVSCHRCQTRIPLIIIPPRSPLWLRPRPKSFLNFCLSFYFCIYLFWFFTVFCFVLSIKYENKIRTPKHLEITAA